MASASELTKTPKRYSLPSGRMVTVYLYATPDRPWEVHEDGGMYVLRREKRGAAGSFQLFCVGQTGPLVLAKSDAEALEEILNSRPPARPSSSESRAV